MDSISVRKSVYHTTNIETSDYISSYQVSNDFNSRFRDRRRLESTLCLYTEWNHGKKQGVCRLYFINWIYKDHSPNL